MNNEPAPGSRPGKSSFYWARKRFRRRSRRLLARLLSAGMGEAPPLVRIGPQEIRRILVVRLNRRLGNMLLLTPLVRSLHATLPHAEIDVAVQVPAFADIFRTLPGVREIHLLPPFSLSHLWSVPRLIWRLRQRKYDLVVDPSSSSFSNRLLVIICGAKRRLGFRTRNQWLSLTHGVTERGGVVHEGRRPLVLVREGFAENQVQLFERLDLSLTPEERAEGRKLRDEKVPADGKPVFGFFTEATGRKQLPREWWLEWIDALGRINPDLRLLQILPPGFEKPLRPDIPAICIREYRRLAALLGSLDLFVCADGGPMHLATASGAPTVGLFRASKTDYYGPLGEGNAALDVRELTPAQAAEAVSAHYSSVK